jgi:hypothetical protein
MVLKFLPLFFGITVTVKEKAFPAIHIEIKFFLVKRRVRTRVRGIASGVIDESTQFIDAHEGATDDSCFRSGNSNFSLVM